jgi:hypothetical protein
MEERAGAGRQAGMQAGRQAGRHTTLTLPLAASFFLMMMSQTQLLLPVLSWSSCYQSATKSWMMPDSHLKMPD